MPTTGVIARETISAIMKTERIVVIILRVNYPFSVLDIVGLFL
jgi:hypothetical protein